MTYCKTKLIGYKVFNFVKTSHLAIGKLVIDMSTKTTVCLTSLLNSVLNNGISLFRPFHLPFGLLSDINVG